MSALFRLLIALVLAGLCAAEDADLARRVNAVIERAPGTVSLFAKNLDTGATFAVKPDERVRTASTIKLPILVALFAEAAAGRVDWNEKIMVTADDKVSGSGVLKDFGDGLVVTLRDLATLMIVVSDNTATNLVLDRIGADTVNRHLEQMGFPHTRSMRKILGDRNQLKPNPSGHSAAGRIEDNKRFGIGSSTPREMVQLLEKIERGEAVNAAASREMIAILKKQHYTDGIGRRMGDTPLASKSGALDALRSDVGIVYTPQGRIAMAITVDGMKQVDWSADNAGEVAVAELAKLLVDALGRAR